MTSGFTCLLACFLLICLWGKGSSDGVKLGVRRATSKPMISRPDQLYRILQAISPHLNTDHRSHFQYCFLQCLYSNPSPELGFPVKAKAGLNSTQVAAAIRWTALGALLPPKQSPTMGRRANKESLLELGDPKDQL